jgi:hypothetical protein
MSTSLAKVNAIYGSKHKKKQRGRVRTRPMLASSSEVNVTRERKANSTTATKNTSSSHIFHSLEPSIRNYLEEYSPYVVNKRKISLEENLKKLEKLTAKNMSARLGLLHVQQRMMELGVKDIMSSGKLATIREDEALYFEDLQKLRDNPIDTLAQKYEQHSAPKLASVSF